MLMLEKEMNDNFIYDFPQRKDYTIEEKIDILNKITQSITEEDIEEWNKAIEENERSKMKLYDDLRTRYEHHN